MEAHEDHIDQHAKFLTYLGTINTPDPNTRFNYSQAASVLGTIVHAIQMGRDVIDRLVPSELWTTAQLFPKHPSPLAPWGDNDDDVAPNPITTWGPNDHITTEDNELYDQGHQQQQQKNQRDEQDQQSIPTITRTLENFSYLINNPKLFAYFTSYPHDSWVDALSRAVSRLQYLQSNPITIPPHVLVVDLLVALHHSTDLFKLLLDHNPYSTSITDPTTLIHGQPVINHFFGIGRPDVVKILLDKFYTPSIPPQWSYTQSQSLIYAQPQNPSEREMHYQWWFCVAEAVDDPLLFTHPLFQFTLEDYIIPLDGRMEDYNNEARTISIKGIVHRGGFKILTKLLPILTRANFRIDLGSPHPLSNLIISIGKHIRYPGWSCDLAPTQWQTKLKSQQIVKMRGHKTDPRLVINEDAMDFLRTLLETHPYVKDCADVVERGDTKLMDDRHQPPHPQAINKPTMQTTTPGGLLTKASANPIINNALYQAIVLQHQGIADILYNHGIRFPTNPSPHHLQSCQLLKFVLNPFSPDPGSSLSSGFPPRDEANQPTNPVKPVAHPIQDFYFNLPQSDRIPNNFQLAVSRARTSDGELSDDEPYIISVDDDGTDWGPDSVGADDCKGNEDHKDDGRNNHPSMASFPLLTTTTTAPNDSLLQPPPHTTIQLSGSFTIFAYSLATKNYPILKHLCQTVPHLTHDLTSSTSSSTTSLSLSSSTMEDYPNPDQTYNHLQNQRANQDDTISHPRRYPQPNVNLRLFKRKSHWSIPKSMARFTYQTPIMMLISRCHQYQSDRFRGAGWLLAPREYISPWDDPTIADELVEMLIETFIDSLFAGLDSLEQPLTNMLEPHLCSL